MLMSLAWVSDPELTEQAHEVRVRALVVDDEAAVDRDGAARLADELVGVRVATQPRLGLVQGHVVGALQQIRRSQARDTGADHRGTGTSRQLAPVARRSSVLRTHGVAAAPHRRRVRRRETFRMHGPDALRGAHPVAATMPCLRWSRAPIV